MTKPLRNITIALALSIGADLILEKIIAPTPERTTLVNLAQTYTEQIYQLNRIQEELNTIKPWTMKGQQLEGVSQHLQTTTQELQRISAYEREHPDYLQYRQATDNHRSATIFGSIIMALTALGSFTYACNEMNKPPRIHITHD